MENYRPGLGANESAFDYRTLQHDQVGAPQIKAIGGTKYSTDKILHQHKVGICTAISLVQNAYVATGKRYSEDFQYLLQKLYTDGNWFEGSSPFSAISTAKKYGMLPIEYLPSILEKEPTLDYDQYKNKLIAIAGDKEKMAFLLSKCEFPIKGYSRVNVTDVYLIAQAIADSKAGIIARFDLGASWYTDKNGALSWNAKDIEPLRKDTEVVSGHQVTITDYNFSTVMSYNGQLANTWGPTWADDGSAVFDLKNYRPTEAWCIYYDFTPDYVPLPDPGTWSHTFVKNMKLGDVTDEVKQLQIKLMMDKFLARITKEEWGIYGPKTQRAVFDLQIARNVPLTFYEKYVLRGSILGPKTLVALNKK